MGKAIATTGFSLKPSRDQIAADLAGL
jgi:hypothetical protein